MQTQLVPTLAFQQPECMQSVAPPEPEINVAAPLQADPGIAVPRLSPEDIQRIAQAKNMGDLGKHHDRMRIAMAAQRECDSGRLSAEACAQHTAAKGKRDGSKLTWLKLWIDGKLPGCCPTGMQAASDTHHQNEQDGWGWFNLPELVKHCGGHMCKDMKTYAQKRWNGSKGAKERVHPDGPHLQKQRRLWKESVETTGRRREQATSVQVSGRIEDPTGLRQMMEACTGPSSSDLAPTCGQDEVEGEPGASPNKKSKKAAEDEKVPDRTVLQLEVYRTLPKLFGQRDALPKDGAGQVARARLEPELQALVDLRSKLEAASLCPSEELEAGRALLKATTGLALRLSKVCAP